MRNGEGEDVKGKRKRRLRRREKEEAREIGRGVIGCSLRTLNVWESLWTDYSRWNASFFPCSVSPYTWRATLASLWRRRWRWRWRWRWLWRWRQPPRQTSCGQSRWLATGTAATDQEERNHDST